MEAVIQSSDLALWMLLQVQVEKSLFISLRYRVILLFPFVVYEKVSCLQAVAYS